MKNIFRLNLYDIDKVDLWKNEKSHFRIWIIIFSVFWTLISLLSLSILIYMLADKTAIVNFLHDGLSKTNEKPSLSMAERAFWTRFIIEFISASIPVSILVTFGISIFKSYKTKTFINISSWALIVSKIHGFLSIINLISFFTSGNKISDQKTFQVVYLVITLIIVVLSIFQLFVVSWNITQIKRLFIMKEMEIKAKEFMEQFNKSIQNNEFQNAFGMNVNPFNNVKEEVKTEEAQEVDKAKEEAVKKILELPNEQLYKMAEMLNIFGYKEMTKEELAEIIYINTKKTKKD
ncbi:hypothetical protein [Mycoplasmopsis edwardii]|uniref:Uncharacterized protein n=1 Tax=Mycoplasmopsis edwardii TaxID=53558 RepID=A0ACD4PJ42_9BACT|nr:hypothetical protein [Mycoplasmopsis edwardii]WBP84098.1 hypothetical protein Me_995_000047 [Mycoplasmopsis edwardii]